MGKRLNFEKDNTKRLMRERYYEPQPRAFSVLERRAERIGRESYGLEFGKPRIVMTRRGAREVCSAIPTKAFWEAWRTSREAVKALGFSVSKKDDGGWEVSHWAETTRR